MINQLDKLPNNCPEQQFQDHPCRVIILGLPRSGKKKVSRILSQKYKCKILHIDPEICLTSDQACKAVISLCFDDFWGYASFVMEECNVKTIKSLNKRNFVSVILVESAFKKRYENYCKASQIQPDLQTCQEFMDIDLAYQNKSFQECLEFVRLKIFNNGTEEDLEAEIAAKIQSILRPFRPNYDEYFMKLADIARRRSNCMKTSVGAVIINNNNRVMSTGYNGTPRGLLSCFKGGCARCNQNSNQALDECLCLHGQQSAILEVGISRTAGCKIYTTMYPCFSCAKLIKQAGIQKLYYMQEYQKADSGQRFLKQNFAESDIIHVNIDNIYY